MAFRAARARPAGSPACRGAAVPRGTAARPAGRWRHAAGWPGRAGGPARDRKSTRLNSSHTVIYTLSLHDALPIFSCLPRCRSSSRHRRPTSRALAACGWLARPGRWASQRSEEHTSELQSHSDLHSFPTRRSSDLLLPAAVPQFLAAPPPDQPGAGGMRLAGPAGPVGQPAQAVTVALADAVQAAHGEGFSFGESVARDAPALWLEAVLARKPRMPSDLEARLLQGSSLPIDSLLHDDVRHALRRGFWDALERARR